MGEVSQAILNGLREFDTATVFNALVRKFGLPNEEYMSHEIRCLLPELGSVVGYAVTAEVRRMIQIRQRWSGPIIMRISNSAKAP